MKAKVFIKNALPPFIVRALRRFFAARPIGFSGDYASWDEAERSSLGYAAPEILARTRAAMLKVKNGEAAFERDSVLFAVMEHQFPLLAGLMRAATANGGHLSVLDFGGSLGSTYFQCRDFLSTVKELRWSIVEQPGHVACGREDFANEQLHFYETIVDCLRAERPNVLLLSGVVQCLPKPYDFLIDILRYDFPNIIVDRTAFGLNGRDRLTVEHVPGWIYPASYPSWFLTEKRFLALFVPRYKLLASFHALDNIAPERGEAVYKGFVFELKQASGTSQASFMAKQ